MIGVGPEADEGDEGRAGPRARQADGAGGSFDVNPFITSLLKIVKKLTISWGVHLRKPFNQFIL